MSQHHEGVKVYLIDFHPPTQQSSSSLERYRTMLKSTFHNQRKLHIKYFTTLHNFLSNSSDFSFFPIELLNEKLCVINALNKNLLQFKQVSTLYNTDKDVVIAAIKEGTSLSSLSDEMQNDKQVVLEALSQHGPTELMFVPLWMKNDPDISQAITNCKNNAKATTNIQNDYSTYLGIFGKKPAENVRNDWNIMLKACLEQHTLFYLCSDELKYNQQFILEILKKHDRLMEMIPKRFFSV